MMGGRRGGRFAGAVAVLLGLVAAVVLVGMRSQDAGGGALRSVELVGQAAKISARQIRALAAGKVRFSMLDRDTANFTRR